MVRGDGGGGTTIIRSRGCDEGVEVRALILVARQFGKIAAELRGLRELYELDLNSRGIYRPTPGMRDDVELSYEVKEPDKSALDW